MDKFCEVLEKMTNLQSLDVSNCEQLREDKIIKALEKLTNLQSLNVFGTRLRPLNIQHKFPNLIVLYLRIP